MIKQLCLSTIIIGKIVYCQNLLFVLESFVYFFYEQNIGKKKHKARKVYMISLFILEVLSYSMAGIFTYSSILYFIFFSNDNTLAFSLMENTASIYTTLRY
jgi:hypothetical protein